MTDLHPVEALLLAVLVLLPMLDAAATWFFLRLFLRSQREPVPGANAPHWRSRILAGRSWLLALLTGAFGIITGAFLLIGLLAGRRVLGYQPLEGGAVLTVIALICLGAIPPAFMWAFWQTRRRRGGPPPFGEND